MKTLELSKIIADCVLKVGKCRHLIELKRRYVGSKGQGYFLTLAQGLLHMKIKTGFSQ